MSSPTMLREASAQAWATPASCFEGPQHTAFGDANADGQPDILQENHYYPFGMAMTMSSTLAAAPPNNYLYNGKELQTELGLDWYDYGARMYDASIGHEAIAADIESEMESRKKQLERKADRKFQRAQKNIDKGRYNRASKLSNQGGNTRLRAVELGEAIQEIQYMGETKLATFSYDILGPGQNVGGTGMRPDGVIEMAIVSSDGRISYGNAIHETSHGYQHLSGDITLGFDHQQGVSTTLNLDLWDEVNAYKRQYAFQGNLNGTPSNNGRIRNMSNISPSWVSGIYNPPNNDLVYKDIKERNISRHRNFPSPHAPVGPSYYIPSSTLRLLEDVVQGLLH